MVTSKVEICNSALIKIGVEPILSFDDNSKEARLCKQQYDRLRRDVLRSHPWNFAIARVELAQTVNEPLFEYSNEYLIPNDVLRILSTDLNLPESITEEPWKVEHSDGNRVLLCNRSQVYIKYLKDIEDVTVFDANFVEALAFRIAADLAYPLIQSTSLAAAMFQAYGEQLRTARSYDGQEGSLEVVRADDFLVSRY